MAVNLRIVMLLALLGCIMAATFARADADDDFDATANDAVDEEEPEDDYVPELKDPSTQFIDGRVLFPDFEIGSALKLAAGEKVRTFVSFQNKVGGTPSEIFIVAAHLNQIGNNDAFVQNFSAVRSMRTVNGGETATVHYDFRPDAMLEPMDYNLVIRVFFLNEDNATFVAVAYNSTVTITDPLGTDFKAITTYFILLALIAGAVYLFSGKNSTIAPVKKSSVAVKTSASPAAADDKNFNKDYVSPEHLKYREQLIKAAANRGGSPKSPASATKKK